MLKLIIAFVIIKIIEVDCFEEVVVFSGTIPWLISDNFSECLKYVGNVQSTICVKRFGL